MFIFHQNIAKIKVYRFRPKSIKPPKTAVLCSFIDFYNCEVIFRRVREIYGKNSHSR